MNILFEKVRYVNIFKKIKKLCKIKIFLAKKKDNQLSLITELSLRNSECIKFEILEIITHCKKIPQQLEMPLVKIYNRFL